MRASSFLFFSALSMGALGQTRLTLAQRLGLDPVVNGPLNDGVTLPPTDPSSTGLLSSIDQNPSNTVSDSSLPVTSVVIVTTRVSASSVSSATPISSILSSSASSSVHSSTSVTSAPLVSSTPVSRATTPPTTPTPTPSPPAAQSARASSGSTGSSNVLTILAATGGVVLVAIIGIYIFRKTTLKKSADFEKRLNPEYIPSFSGSEKSAKSIPKFIDDNQLQPFEQQYDYNNQQYDYNQYALQQQQQPHHYGEHQAPY